MKIKWKCRKCGEEHISDTVEHHNANFCKCGKSGLDAEEHYTRILGEAEIIK